MNLLLASEQNTGTLVLLLVLVVACVALFVVNYFRNKKYMDQQREMLDSIEVGSKILTKTFMYGEVVQITDTTDGKILLVKSGSGENVGYFEINLEGVYSLDKKEEVVELPEDLEETEEVEEVVVEETKEEVVEAPKPTRKPRKSKKSE